MRKLGYLLLLVIVSWELRSAGTPTLGSTAQSGNSRNVLPGHVPPWAKASTLKGQPSGTDWVGLRVYLNWQNSSDVAALAASVSDPRNSAYGQYLTPAQFRARFSPPQASIVAVQQWLRNQGFNIVYTPQNNLYVSAEGTVAQAAAAFQVNFGLYSVQNLTLRAPSNDASIPASLNGIVSAVLGLDQTDQLVHLHMAVDPDAPPSPGFVSPQPCSAFWGEKLAGGFTNPYGTGPLPYAPCGYTPDQIRAAYGISGYDGAGQTVAIIDAYASPTIQQDLDQWSANRGLPSTKITQVVAPGTYNHPQAGLKQDPQGWYGEETLDVEAVHGMAPAAKIVYVGSANNFRDLDTALNHVVDRGLAQIVTNSYGYAGEFVPPGFIIPYQNVLLQAAVEGIGIYFSSGDDNDESLVLGIASADWPASSPLVTAVGGTSLAVGAANNYLFETGWGTDRSRWTDNQGNFCNGAVGSTWTPNPPGVWLYGAGGGVSRLFGEPSYQVGVVPQAVFAAQGRVGRAVPDVSALADPNTGYLIGQTQQFPNGSHYGEYRIGGTSLASPLMAGIMALADQAKGSPHGFANPALYRLAGTAAVNDIVDPASTVAAVRSDYCDSVTAASGTFYSLRTMNQTLSLHTTPGWDDVTGIGTPTASFISALRF